MKLTPHLLSKNLMVLNMINELGTYCPSSDALTPEQKIEGGITENLIRISVGLEDVRDLIADLERGLNLL